MGEIKNEKKIRKFEGIDLELLIERKRENEVKVVKKGKRKEEKKKIKGD